jgi:hypothetical protein
MSAQDVEARRIYRISGFGPARVSAVLSWARGIEQLARAGMPRALSNSQAHTIRVKYGGRHQVLGEELQRAETQQRNDEAEIRAKFGAVRQELDNVDAVPKAAAERELRTIQENRDRAVAVYKSDETRVLEAAKTYLTNLDVKAAELRKLSLRRQWEQARASARVKAYAPVTFTRYFMYVVLGVREVR